MAGDEDRPREGRRGRSARTLVQRRRGRAAAPTEAEPEHESIFGDARELEPSAAEQRSERRARAPREPRKPLMAPQTVQRVIWALPWIVFAVFIVVEGGLIFTLALVMFAVVGLHELYEMYGRLRPVVAAGFIGATGLILAAHFGDQYQIVMVAAGAVLVTFLLSLNRKDFDGITASFGITLLGVFWVGLALAHAVLLRDLPHGDGLVVDALVAVFIGDTAAYGAGRAFGRRKMAPSISPNKTWEGLVAGLLIAVLAFWCAGLYQDWLKGWEALALGACVAVAAPLGDLFESIIKRDAGVKDTGRFFGPHGGVLDRLDAVMFAAVVTYYAARAILGI